MNNKLWYGLGGIFAVLVAVWLGSAFIIYPPASSLTTTPTTIATSTGETPVSEPSTLPAIQQVNAPATVSVSPGGVAEIRNKSYYFTLQGLTPTEATIEVTQVGCWNSFPSDPLPRVHCMIAVVPIPPQTLSIGDSYTVGSFSATLSQISNGAATFTLK